MSGEAEHLVLERARHGDRAALEELLMRHQAEIYRFGLKMCGDPEDAKDVVQETLLAMARGLREFRGASSISTWLYAIARSYCLKKRRRSKFAPKQEQSLDVQGAKNASTVVDPSQTPDDALASKQVEQALERAIADLEPMYREVLLLRDVEGLRAPEVAEVLGVSVEAVKSRLHRARLAVRAELAPMFGESPAATQARSACPDVLTLLSQHLEDEISADVCAQMEQHLTGCGRCRGACDSLRRTLALCRTSGAAVEVPPKVQALVKVALRDFLAEKT